eukprot:2852775-Prymnesium_polylepis.1
MASPASRIIRRASTHQSLGSDCSPQPTPPRCRARHLLILRRSPLRTSASGPARPSRTPLIPITPSASPSVTPSDS